MKRIAMLAVFLIATSLLLMQLVSARGAGRMEEIVDDANAPVVRQDEGRAVTDAELSRAAATAEKRLRASGQIAE